MYQLKTGVDSFHNLFPIVPNTFSRQLMTFFLFFHAIKYIVGLFLC